MAKHKDFGYQRSAPPERPDQGAHQIKLQRSLIDGTIDRCGRQPAVLGLR
jgi:hypothetical protein